MSGNISEFNKPAEKDDKVEEVVDSNLDSSFLPDIPDRMLARWQKIIDLMAAISKVPSGLIMKVHKTQIEVFLTSNSKGNPYPKGEKADLQTGLYCETVMSQRNFLLVPDAREDPLWANNPDIKLGMVSYFGLPIIWPNGDIFGTICVLDNKENSYSDNFTELIQQFKETIELDLQALFDISAHKKIRDKLQESKELIKATLESTADGILVVDENGKVVHTNARFVNMWRIPAIIMESNNDDKLLEFVLGQLVAPEAFLFKVRYLYGTTLEDLDTLQFKDSRVFERFSCPLINDKKIAGRVWSFRDITKRMQTEKELKEKTHLNQIFLDAFPWVAVLARSNWEIVLANKAGREVYAYPGKRCYEVRHNRKTACPQCLALKALQTGKPQQIEFENNETVWDVHWVPVGADLYLNYIIDITDRKRYELELIKMEKLKSLGILAGGIAHDFNNLLTGIMGNVSLAKLEINPEEDIYDDLDEVEKATIRAKDLTQQLLTFSKGGEPVKVISSISVLIKDTVPFVLHGSNVKPEFSIADNLYNSEIDTSQISQVLHNIVLNGNQAMPNGGKISVSAENVIVEQQSKLPVKDGRFVKITIEDEGTGIPPEHIEKIFDPYFTTKQDGTGLGLSTSYSIIQKHKGHIEAESENGKGSRFIIYLPATDKKHNTKKLTPDKIIKGCGRILVMDDEAIIRDLAKKVLTKYGYTVDCVNKGESVIKLYQQAIKKKKPYDVVILDLTILNGMGGKETIEKLRVIDPQVKAIVCSGYSNDPVMSDYKKNYFSGVVSKPYRPIDLVQAVINLLNSDLISDTKELSANAEKH